MWYERRSNPLVVRDGHSLYMETLAELGVVGLLILACALLIPIGAAISARSQRFVATGLGAFVAWCAAASLDWHWEMVGVTMTALLAGSIGLLAAERSALGEPRPRARGALIGGTVVVSVLAVWSLVGNQALFASREALGHKEWNEAREDGRRAEALLFWSAEPELALGDAAAGLGDREGALRAYRAAVRTDPRSWVTWLDVAQVARGAERAAAYRRVHALNPVDRKLPGE
jgi:hypothetical protein